MTVRLLMDNNSLFTFTNVDEAKNFDCEYMYLTRNGKTIAIINLKYIKILEKQE